MSALHVFVNSGADSVSQSVSPNQKVGRSWKFHVPPPPPLSGRERGSWGSVTTYVMSLPEPGTPDLNSSDGSSCPTYSSPSVSYVSMHREWWLSHSGSW